MLGNRLGCGKEPDLGHGVLREVLRERKKEKEIIAERVSEDEMRLKPRTPVVNSLHYKGKRHIIVVVVIVIRWVQLHRV